MPGRTAAQAREAFLRPLRRALSCVTRAQLLTTGDEDLEILTLSQHPLPLRSPFVGQLELRLRQHFIVVEDSPRDWHVSTLTYDYRINGSDGREVVSWHWHPGRGPLHPHIHSPVEPFGRRVHLPTGRVGIEAVLRLLLTDLQIQPTAEHRRDFARVLDKTEQDFIKHRRWH